MHIVEVKFEHFRSFGPSLSSIKIDPILSFFVGKNHTGKSNLFKIFHEMKEHKIPENQKYLLNPANWFNYEAGVDRPLKIQIECILNQYEYQFICFHWFLKPLTDALKSYANVNQNLEYHHLTKKFKTMIDDHCFLRLFPEYSCKMRLEFIRIDSNRQDLNYSLEFNNFIMVHTADGRKFLQNIGSPFVSKFREESQWQKWCYAQIESYLQNILPSNLQIDDLLTVIVHSGEKFSFHESQINLFFDYFFNKIQIFHSNRQVQSKAYIPAAKVEQQVLNKSLAQLILKKMNRINEKSSLWYQMNDLLEHFESIYESLDITFGITHKNSEINLEYYNRTANRIIYNFDSIGYGITSILKLLYQLILEKNLIIALDTPEYQLHPHSQRNLYNLIKEYAQKNHHQLIIITHSPYFMHPDDLFQLRLFNLVNGKTTVSQVEIPKDDHNFFKLKRNFSIGNRDAIFADGLIFVEGVTEEWAFPYFFSAFGLDLDLFNFSLINLHGKGNFNVYWHFAHQLRKKFWFFFDNDFLGVKAGEQITKELFKRSVLYKNREILPSKIQHIIFSMIHSENLSSIEFHEELEHLRALLEEVHIFVLRDDFEGIFESLFEHEIEFCGGKVEKSFQLIDYLQKTDDFRELPPSLFHYFELIQDDLRS